MSSSEATDAAASAAPSRSGSVEPPPASTLADTTIYSSSRTIHSSSRLSHYTDAATRRSSYQSAQASIYQDTETSLGYDDASEGFDHLDLDSDLEVRSQRAPSRNTVSPFQPSIAHGADGDAVETTLDESMASSSNTSGGMARRRSSYKRQSVEMSRPISSLSRRSSGSTVHEDPQTRLREAAAAAASRSSMSRRRSQEIDQLTNSISRASTPHGFRTEDDDDATTSQPRSRPGSSLALRKYDQDGESFIKRDNTKERGGSILPPAGFFAPKKPAARNSSSNLLGTSPHGGGGGRSTTPLSFYSNAAPGEQTDEEVLQRSASPMAMPGRAPSPWGLEPSTQLNAYGNGTGRRYSGAGGDGTAPLHPLDPSDGFPSPSAGHPSPHSVVRMMASTDPLLPARAISGAAVSNTTTNGNLDDASHNAGLGFESVATTAKSHSEVPAQRASLSATKPSSPTENGMTPHGHTAATAAAAAAPPPIKTSRNYRNHQGSNRFFLSGLLMTSSDNPLPFLLSFLLLLALGGLFYGFESRWLTLNISPSLIAIFTYIYLQAIVNMLVTAFRDPGIIPRNLDPDPPCTLGETPFEAGRHTLADPEDPMAIPVQRVLRIRTQTVQVKWCETCGTYRPPRSSHCRVCDNCVENIDHHCTYLNTCIGRRNYVSFMVFLLASIGSALFVIGCTAARLVLLTKPRSYRYPRDKGDVTAPGLSFKQALGNSPVSAVLFLLSIGVVAPLLVLFTYHVRLVLLNRSTVEQIRINATRKYGGHKDVELGTHGYAEEDAGSNYDGQGRSSSGVTARARALMERFGVLKPKHRDPNPFAARKKSTNVRNALGWRSVQLESWIQRRERVRLDERKPHPRVGGKGPSGAATNGLQWKA